MATTSVGREAASEQRIADAVGALAGEVVVERVAADGIGVADDDDVEDRALLQSAKTLSKTVFESSVSSSLSSTK